MILLKPLTNNEIFKILWAIYELINKNRLTLNNIYKSTGFAKEKVREILQYLLYYGYISIPSRKSPPKLTDAGLERLNQRTIFKK